jgi:hypothetical protein
MVGRAQSRAIKQVGIFLAVTLLRFFHPVLCWVV